MRNIVTKIYPPMNGFFIDSHNIADRSMECWSGFTDYELVLAVFDLCGIEYRTQPDSHGNPFWLSSERGSAVHFHVKFSAGGEFFDCMIGKDSRYCRCA